MSKTATKINQILPMPLTNKTPKLYRKLAHAYKRGTGTRLSAEELKWLVEMDNAIGSICAGSMEL